MTSCAFLCALQPCLIVGQLINGRYGSSVRQVLDHSSAYSIGSFTIICTLKRFTVVSRTSNHVVAALTYYSFI